MQNFLVRVMESVMEYTDSWLLDPELHRHRLTKTVISMYSQAMEFELLHDNQNEFKVATQYFGPFYRSKNTYVFRTPFLEGFRKIRRILVHIVKALFGDLCLMDADNFGRYIFARL